MEAGSLRLGIQGPTQRPQRRLCPASTIRPGLGKSLLVVCDLDRFRIHTNWTNSISEVHEFSLDDLRDANVRQKLKWVFSDPERLKPGKTRQALTEEAAAEFAKLAQRLRDRGHAAETVAHFINRLVFCMFAEDVDLLPNKMFTDCNRLA